MDTTREILISIRREFEDSFEEVLFTFDITGIEVEDCQDVNVYLDDHPEWEISDFEYSFSDEIILKIYLPEDQTLAEELKHLDQEIKCFNELHPDARAQIIGNSYVAEKDWANEWKKYYTTLRISNSFVIVPCWESYAQGEGDIVIQIDPGMAFGTGTHETTRMCLEQLEKIDIEGRSILDIGCGSGILSIAAKKMKAQSVVAVDIDPLAVESAAINFRLNGVEDSIDLRQGDILRQTSFERKYDVVLANLLADLVIGVLGKAKDFLSPKGIFIASGILNSQQQKVLEAFKAYHFQILNVDVQGEWVVICAQYDDE